jgi:hypothetical protein
MLKKLSLSGTAIVIATSAWAVPIRYTYEGVGLGVFGGKQFDLRSFVITGVAEAANIEQDPGGTIKNAHLSTKVWIEGLGGATVSTQACTGV